MQSRLARNAMRLALAAAVMVPAGARPAEPRDAAEPTGRLETSVAREWNPSSLYRNTFSARRLIGAEVRGEEGAVIGEVKDILMHVDAMISRVVVEAGGFFELGDQHIGVPWEDVRLGPGLRWVEVPLREVENGSYSLYGRRPQGDAAELVAGEWRVNELIGDFASLRDVSRYGLVIDLIFNSRGQAQAVVVDRRRGPWGEGGPHAYPFAGYYPGSRTYLLPYGSERAAAFAPFDYARLEGGRSADRPLGGPASGTSTSGTSRPRPDRR